MNSKDERTERSDFTLSVIIPKYNNEKYIRQCLDSIIEQSYTVKEIIIFDDCSTDGSRNVLREYELKYSNIKVIYSDENVGVSNARDRAIKATTSDYITMIDADDFYYDRDKLKREMSMVEEYYHKTNQKVCTFSQTVKVDEESRVIGTLKKKALAHLVRFRTVTRLYRVYTPRDYCVPKEAYLATGGYKPEMNLYEDWDLNLRLFKPRERYSYKMT